MERFIGCPLSQFEEEVSLQERQQVEVRYTLSRPEHMDDPERTRRIIMARNHVLYVACFRDGLPREGEKQD